MSNSPALIYVISLGANVGNAQRTIQDELKTLPKKLNSTEHHSSSLYTTDPVGGPPQPDFVNAVLVVTATLTPRQVLSVLHDREAAWGRVRQVRWGPRTLDLDIISAGDVIEDSSDLVLPHPRAHERAFVLVPWLEVDPNARLVGRGAVSELIQSLDTSGVRRLESTKGDA